MPEYTRIVKITGHLFFLVLGIFSLIFYKERLLYYDSAFYSFQMIDQLNFAIAHIRWSAVVNELLPVALIKWGVPLKFVLIGYSFSFILVQYICFLVIQYVLRQTEYALVLLLSLCLTFRITFYSPTAELFTAIAMSSVYGALLQSFLNKHASLKIMHLFALVSFAIFLSYFHQLAVLMALFFILLQTLLSKNLFRKDLLILAGITAAWMIIRIKLLTTSSYEQEKMVTTQVFFSELFNLQNNPTFDYFLRFSTQSILIPVCLFFFSIILLASKHIWAALFIPAFTAVYVLLTVITLYRGESIIMTEYYFAVFGIFMASPLLILLKEYNWKILIAISSLMLVFSVVEIYKSSKPLTRRVGIINNLINYGNQLPQRKYIIDEANISSDYYLPSWAFPFESLIQSTLTGPDNHVSFFIRKPGMKLDSTQITKQGVFLGPDWAPFRYNTHALNSTYFNLPDGPYLELSSSQDTPGIMDSLYSAKGIKLEAVHQELRDDETQSVRISNVTPFILPSVPGKQSTTYLSYHLVDEAGKMVRLNNPKTVLMLDVHPGTSFVQEIIIEKPEEPGTYTVQLDLITEADKWWGINAPFKFIVE